jgi:hypothetical protein
MMKRGAILTLVLLIVGLVTPLTAEEEVEMIVIPHLGGSLAVNLDAVETVFYMERDGRQRFHMVWHGNAEGKTVEGAEALEVWNQVRNSHETAFIWVSHMGGTMGIAHEAITSLFFMPAKDGKAAMLRVNYGPDAKTVEGEDALTLWKSLSN